MTSTGPTLKLNPQSASEVMVPFLPFAAPWFGPEEKDEILKVLDSDWITTGPRARAFETAFREYIGCKEAVAVNSCTAALHLALSVLDIGTRDAVLTSPFTFAATANVIVHRGAQPVFVDIRPDTYNLDPTKLREFIQKQCSWESAQQLLRVKNSQRQLRAIIPVHYGGHPADMDEIVSMARQYKLAIIEDAAHALGASYSTVKVGTLGDMACFSFYPTKNISTGEGGMLTTENPVFAHRARILSLHGISRDAWKRNGKEGSWQYDVQAAGYKYNLTDLAAALGLHQLEKLELFLHRRAELAAYYTKELADLPLKLPTVLAIAESAWHLYPVQILAEGITRDALIEELRSRNIGTSVHFIPLHLMTFYKKAFGYKRGDFPVAEEVFERILSLPFFPRMRNEDAARVVGKLHEILSARF
jgi:dTDP-4-amino-4,6-dideoxygalactose transaminase